MITNIASNSKTGILMPRQAVPARAFSEKKLAFAVVKSERQRVHVAFES